MYAVNVIHLYLMSAI